MKGCAADVIAAVDVHPSSEVQEGQYHILLCGEMQRVESCFGAELVVGSALF